jgi:hypothetical protein
MGSSSLLIANLLATACLIAIGRTNAFAAHTNARKISMRWKIAMLIYAFSNALRAADGVNSLLLHISNNFLHTKKHQKKKK